MDSERHVRISERQINIELLRNLCTCTTMIGPDAALPLPTPAALLHNVQITLKHAPHRNGVLESPPDINPSQVRYEYPVECQ